MKSLRWLVIELLGFVAVLCMLTYITFIFLIGIYPDSVPEVLMETSSARNLFIATVHTLGYILLLIHLTAYIRPKDFDSVPIAVSAVNIVLYTLCLVLVWRCYFMDELEPLIFVITIYGIMLSAFRLTIGYTMYSVIDDYKKKTVTGNFMYKIINFGAILFFVAAIATYYRYVSNILYSQFGVIMRSRDVDALALFCYMVGYILQAVAFIVGYFLDKSSIKYLKMYRKAARE